MTNPPPTLFASVVAELAARGVRLTARPAQGKRRRRPLRMTPKAVNKRRRLAHLRKMRARAKHLTPSRTDGKQ